MKIEVIAIGSELLSGKTINSNAQYICKRLFDRGYVCNHASVLPDLEKEIKQEIKNSLKRSDVLIVTGGLGPTLDDNTKQIICDLLKIPLKYREDIAKDIKKRFGNIASLENQSTAPQSGYIFKNEVGTAPGLAFLHLGKAIILLPGVPSEMEDMFEKHVLCFMEKHYPVEEKVYQEIINTYLLPELKVDAALRSVKKDEDVTLGIYPSFGSVQITITTRAKEEVLAKKKINEVKKQVLEDLQDYIFESENGRIEEAIHNILFKNHQKLAFAESCSGGALASKITKLPGSSKYFLGSFVTYSNELKKNILKVKESTLKNKGAVSMETAREMVEGVFDITDAAFALAISGIAGPGGGTKEKPVGTVYMAIGKKNDKTDTGVMHFQGNRNAIIEQACNFALAILLRRITHNLLYFEK